jgi:hypothetical protein
VGVLLLATALHLRTFMDEGEVQAPGLPLIKLLISLSLTELPAWTNIVA